MRGLSLYITTRLCVYFSHETAKSQTSATKEKPILPKRKLLTDEQIDQLIARLIGDTDQDTRANALMVLMDEIHGLLAAKPLAGHSAVISLARLATRTAFQNLDEAMDAQIQLLRTEI
jgi:hypothetical protein